ncbi:MAG: phosphohydrolase [Denitrovibrio sp.]|nr:MAG: phosphohydrolase [Denitrovibrio sp.]
MFFLVASIVMLFMALYTTRILLKKRWISIGLVTFCVMFLTFIARLIMREYGNSELLTFMLWIGVVVLGIVSILFCVAVIKHVLSITGFLVSRASPKFSPSRRAFLTTSLGTGMSLAVLPVAGYGVYRAVGAPVIKSIALNRSGTHAGLKGFKIVQLTDIHAGLTIGSGTVQRIVNMVNELDADAVVITGDLVDGSAEYVSDYIGPLKDIKSTYGTFFVTGNHEYYSGVTQWMEVVRGLGINVLSNSNRIINHNDAKLMIAGIPDIQAKSFGFEAPDPKKAKQTDEDYDFSVIMSHRPEIADYIAKHGFDLQLSGHTHGGQYFPWTIAIHLFHKYVRGLYDLGDMHLYVSQGTAYWGPPLRIGAESEITLITL